MAWNRIPFASTIGGIIAGIHRGTQQRLVARPRRIHAVYLFHRSGDPLAMVASEHVPPFEPEQLEPIIGAVRDFVETSVPSSRGHRATSMRFDREGFVAVRGAYVSVCAVYESGSESRIRRDLMQFVQEFEAGAGEHLRTWEEATRFAVDATDRLSRLLERAPTVSRTSRRIGAAAAS